MTTITDADNQVPGLAAEQNRPWYKERWMWFVFSIPAISIPLGITMIVLAINTNNAMVVDDYYVQGKSINQRIERDNYASTYGVSAGINFINSVVMIDLKSTDASLQLPNSITLQLVHVTQESRDINVKLMRDENGVFSSNSFDQKESLNRLASEIQSRAQYRIHLLPDNNQWRLVGKLQPFTGQQTLHATALDSPNE